MRAEHAELRESLKESNAQAEVRLCTVQEECARANATLEAEAALYKQVRRDPTRPTELN
jgi:hypothetical protein